MENVDLLTRINQHYNSFSKGQKLLANYIIDNYDRAAFITASKMGRTVGVSESTVVRFAYALGYDGYPALQRSLQEMIRNRLTTVQRIQLTSDLSQDEVLSTVLKSDISNIRSTIESVNTATFNTVIDYMLKARKIYVVGIKSAAPLAQFLGYYLNFILDDVCIVNSTVYETMLRISDKDMCIGISFPRYSSKAVEARSDMASFADSLAAPLSLINALIVGAGLRRKDEVYERLDQLEGIWKSHKVYIASNTDDRDNE